ncbi:BQ2448_3811 [Microbotryum intermedium]|uniref:BQ2448_3811 protein n=1 Tax=Microbotryum intermedium TaxID=269621 RepID=A0A238FE29_9BASI|nr:BQ2448_3811 [Microbotryum intermedium]
MFIAPQTVDYGSARSRAQYVAVCWLPRLPRVQDSANRLPTALSMNFKDGADYIRAYIKSKPTALVASADTVDDLLKAVHPDKCKVVIVDISSMRSSARMDNYAGEEGHFLPSSGLRQSGHGQTGATYTSVECRRSYRCAGGRPHLFTGAERRKGHQSDQADGLWPDEGPHVADFKAFGHRLNDVLFDVERILEPHSEIPAGSFQTDGLRLHLPLMEFGE